MSIAQPSVLRRIANSLMLVALLPAAACYHQVVETGKPASPTVIDKPWQMSFIYGLVPPPAVSTASQCPGGVAKVETQQSFVNGLVAMLTFGIVTPMQVTITCATGGTASSVGSEKISVGELPGGEAAAITQAAERAYESGRAVLVQF